MLGVLPSSDDRTVKTRFRRLAALHHPDKVRLTPGNGSDMDADSYFVHLKLAQDTLLDPVKRFAYDRFGKSVVEGSRRKKMRDFLYDGLQMLLPHYVGGLSTMLILNYVWFPRWGRYVSRFPFIGLEGQREKEGRGVPLSSFPLMN